MSTPLSTDNRVYRKIAPSDLPKIQSGVLKAFYKVAEMYHPARLISTRVSFMPGYAFHEHVNVWIVTLEKCDMVIALDNSMYVDITPTKRYAIWNHKQQRFCNLGTHPTATGFTSKQDAEIWRDNYFSPEHLCDYYVVEWEIKE